MPSTVFTQQIAASEFIGDSLEKINSNFSNLQTVTCDLSADLSGVITLAVAQLRGGVNVNVTPVSGSGDVTLYPNNCPEWHVGLTGNPLHLETGGNRVSKQLALSASFFKHLNDVVSYNPVMPNTITIEELGTTPSSGEGAIMLADGNIYMNKSGYASLDGSTLIYDVKTNKTFSAAAPTTGLWSSAGVLMSNGKIIFFPTTAGLIAQIYDPATNSVSTAGGSHWGSVSVTYGGVVLFDGRVYMNATGAGPSIVYDPATNTTSLTPNCIGNSGSCFILPDGKVYRIPGYYISTGTGNTKATIYDPNANTWTLAPGVFPSTARGFHMGRLLPNGTYLILPSDPACGGARIFNPYASSDEAALRPTTTNGWYSAPFVDIYYGGTALLPDGRVLCAPWQADKVLIYDYKTDTTETYSVPLNGAYGNYSGALMLENGKVLVVPYSPSGSRKCLLISTYNQKSFSLAALTGPHFNRTY